MIHNEKINNTEIQISFAFSPDFPPSFLLMLWSEDWSFSPNVGLTSCLSWLLLLPSLEGVSLSVPPSYKMVDGCHRSEKLLKKLPGWREKIWEEVFLSSPAFVSGQVDPMKPLTFQTAAPMGKVSLTMHCNVQVWMSVRKYHTAYHLAEKFMWVSSNLF